MSIFEHYFFTYGDNMKISVEIPLTRKNIESIAIHFLMFAGVIIIASHLYSAFDTMQFAIKMIAFGASMFILLSILDELNFIELRKTSFRLTKCAICNKTYKKEYMDTSSQTVVETEQKDNDKTEVKTEMKKIPAKPLTGFAINGELICSECISTISELKHSLG